MTHVNKMLYNNLTRYRGLGPDRYMTISVHTTSVHDFRQIRNLDHFGTCTTSVRVSRVPHRYIPLRYIALTTSVQCHIGTLLRDTVGPGDRRRLSDYLLCEQSCGVDLTTVKLKWGHAGEVSQAKKKLNKALNENSSLGYGASSTIAIGITCHQTQVNAPLLNHSQ